MLSMSEIPNSFEDYFSKFSILNFFEIYKMDYHNIEPLIVTKEITSNIQIVANYLKIKNNNNIDKRGLFFSKFTLYRRNINSI